jgi:hypothetical protein
MDRIPRTIDTDNYAVQQVSRRISAVPVSVPKNAIDYYFCSLTSFAKITDERVAEKVDLHMEKYQQEKQLKLFKQYVS